MSHPEGVSEQSATTAADHTSPRAVIVGAGPAGFYAAEQLLAAGFAVDVLDALPTPFGLVRSGVAPDHPKIKAVTRVYEKTAAREGFRFFGGVALGEDVTREDLLRHYHAVVYAFGTSDDRRLGIPGEDRPGSHPATRFVSWYNGHPDAPDEVFDLSVDRAVVVGNGNVAVDVARMLVLDPDELAPTDTADHAITAFGGCGVREVVLLGRRGPAEAAFTNPELRELGKLRRADVVVDPADLAGLEDLDTPNLRVLREYAAREPRADASHRVVLRFLRSPLEVLGEGEDGQVTGLRVGVNRLEDGQAVPTGEEEVIACGLVLRAVGYRGRPVAGLPFDEGRGVLVNDGGRVARGEYAVGWIKRGPSGVIGTNKKDATQTVARMLEDREAGALNVPADPDPDAVAELFGDAVAWEGWRAIDELERRAGEPAGRPRVKLVRLDDLRAAARGQAVGR
jgi:ferredoxin--NADP+ reductase